MTLPPLRPDAPPELTRLIRRLEDSQWHPAARHEAEQMREFGRLARHCYDHCDHFRSRLDDAGLDPGQSWTAQSFARIPLLRRIDLLDAGPAMHCRTLSPAHGAVQEVQTSGSTGQVVAVRRTGLSGLIWLASTMRDHLWHDRDFAATMAVIRPGMPRIDDPETARRRGWGPPASLLTDTGPCYMLPLNLDVRAQADWLLERNPDILLSFPSNIAALLDRFDQMGRRPPALRHLRTVGETLTAALRHRIEADLNARVVDMYSSAEVGIIALQCPSSPLYHLQSETLIVELLNEQGGPCAPGEVGRVVVTDLFNYATPLIRYEIRDYAEVGPPCACGRGLPSLTRILGRSRNMLRLPDGQYYWPLFYFQQFRNIARILQYQVVQHSLDDIEVRLVTEGALNAGQEKKLAAIIRGAMGYPFALRFTYFAEELPDSRGGKFEEFISLITEPPEARTSVRRS